MVMSKAAQIEFFLPSTTTQNWAILEGFNQLNQTEEPAIMGLDNKINIQKPLVTRKNCIPYNGNVRYYSHRPIQNISNNRKDISV
jgi:hypothetical protein